MNKPAVMALIGTMALFLGSCGGDAPSTTAQSPSPGASPSASASPGASPTASPTAKSQPFTAPQQPLIAQQPAPVVAVPGLVQGTNPDERLKETTKGRKDPFALLPVQPKIEVSPSSLPGKPSVKKPGLPSLPNPAARRPPVLPALPQSPTKKPAIASVPSRVPKPTTVSGVPKPTTASGTPKPTTASGTPKPTTASGTPKPTTAPSFKPELPTIPEPELARSIEVTGVVQVGGVTQVIVKLPNSSSPFYVPVGTRIANSQLLVKRVEMNGNVPVIIFEQYGIEVAKRVGDPPEASPSKKPGKVASSESPGLPAIANPSTN